jgi:predicted enzyme involved in methoxymalonyl-ACP biosynthesis
MDKFIEHLPIDNTKFAQLISEEGLDGYKLCVYMSGNAILQKKEQIIKHLNGDSKREIIEELNQTPVTK